MRIAAEGVRVGRGGGLALRVASAAVLAPLFLWLCSAGGKLFFALVGALSLLALHELAAMASFGRRQRVAVFAMALVTFAGLGWRGLSGLALAAALWPFLAALALLAASPEERKASGQDLWVLHGALTWAFGLAFLVLIRSMPAGRTALFGLLALVWSQDSFAYFVGKAFGRHRLAPTVSPKKTWEGTAGGFVLSLVTAWLLMTRGFGEAFGAASLGAFALAAVAAQVGDLAESLVKRHFECKDSGHIIPGHGGVMDRFDSLSFAAPVFYVTWTVITLAHLG